MRFLRSLLLLLPLLCAIPVAACAQEAAPPPSSAVRRLPAQPEPPRTLRAQVHVYAAFTLAWLLVFGYAVSLGRRFARVERELERIEASLPPA